MSDFVPITPGVGADIAVDTIAGKNHQRVKVQFGTDGTAVDVSAESPMPVQTVGELIEAIEAMRMAIAALTKTIGFALPNALGQPIFEARQGTAGNLLMTASLAGGQTLATLTNQTQIGGFAANDQIPALMHLQADNFRRNITVS